MTQEDIVISHRLGKRAETGDRHRVVIVRFNRVNVCDEVIPARSRLRNSVSENQHQIFVNEDLTQRRAALASATRQLKRAKKIADCWTYNGKVVIKTLANTIRVIHTQEDMNTLR